MTTYAPIEWFRFKNFDGRRWRVFLAGPDDKHAEDLDDNYGMTYFDSGRVLIEASGSRDEQDVILLHELMHVCCDDQHGRDKDEERIVNKLAPRLLPLLRKFGLRFPRRPPGAVALEQRISEEEVA